MDTNLEMHMENLNPINFICVHPFHLQLKTPNSDTLALLPRKPSRLTSILYPHALATRFDGQSECLTVAVSLHGKLHTAPLTRSWAPSCLPEMIVRSIARGDHHFGNTHHTG